jgi:hypothetical protein
MERFASQGYIIPVLDETLLEEAIEQSHSFVTKPYVSESQGIINEVYNFIDNNVKKAKK